MATGNQVKAVGSHCFCQQGRKEAAAELLLITSLDVRSFYPGPTSQPTRMLLKTR